MTDQDIESLTSLREMFNKFKRHEPEKLPAFGKFIYNIYKDISYHRTNLHDTTVVLLPEYEELKIEPLYIFDSVYIQDNPSRSRLDYTIDELQYLLVNDIAECIF